MLKLREIAKSFYRNEVGNGPQTSLWFDKWSDRGVIYDLLGARSFIDMGIRREATVEKAVFSQRQRRRHRLEILNDIEEELRNMRDNLSGDMDDVSQWRRESGYNLSFSTSKTWKLIRETKKKCVWARGVWFSQETPKYAFMVWLANLDRLSTMDIIARWNPGVDEICVLCKNACENRDHLFFECPYSVQI